MDKLNIAMHTYHSSGLTDKRREVVDELKRLQERTEQIIKIFEDPEVVKMIQSSR